MFTLLMQPLPAMIFLRDNELLESDLTFEHVKPRLLGHWGTCPGIILVWSHLNLLIRNHDLDMIFVIGPGHGAPAALASLWLEGSLQKFYPRRYDLNRQGLRRLINEFSLPLGFPRFVSVAFPLPSLLSASLPVPSYKANSPIRPEQSH
jgi:xylulose-5-phosphate/fructose-6-phosphate phosphoketolase